MRRTLLTLVAGYSTGLTLAQGPSEPVSLPGIDVSRPLTSVIESKPAAENAGTALPETRIPTSESTKAEETLTHKGLPKHWSRYELLMWFPKAQPLPPLLMGSPGALSPVLGSPGASTLIGGQSIDNPLSTGGRFVSGWDSDDNGWGTEISYLFTGTRTATAGYDGTGRNVNLGRPIVDPTTGQESFIEVSAPGRPGRFRATTTNRMTGWEVNAVHHLDGAPTCHLNFVAGYRFFLHHEGVRLEQTQSIPHVGGGNYWANAADQFDGHTRFHGGQIGLEFGQDFNRFFVEGSMKVALGTSYNVVKIGGQTNIIVTGQQPGPMIAPMPGGVFAQPSNSGRQCQSDFAVLPEGQFRIGYKFRDRSRFYVGYNFLYLSDAVRPGDQIDRTISQAMVAAANGGVAAPAGLRPQASFTRTDLWVQGINLGFEWNY